MSATQTPALDMDKLNQFVGQFVNDFGATAHAGLVVIGEKLGLYKAMANNGPMTSAQLATKTNTDERYVREWLSSQAAGGYVTYDDATGKFSLSWPAQPDTRLGSAAPKGAALLGPDALAALIEQQPGKLDKPSRAARRQQRHVELAMKHRPVFGRSRRVLRHRMARQRMKRGHQSGFPGHIAVADGAGERLRFDDNARRHGVFDIVGGKRRDAKTALADGRDQALRNKPRQRFAQRTDADAVMCPQLVGAQRRARPAPRR